MNSRFTNRHVLVTGGARGIGLEIVRRFCEAGAMVSIFDYNSEALDQTASQLRANGHKVNASVVDVSDQQQVTKAVEAAEQIAPIDVLVNNAGICEVTPFLNIEANEWQKTLDINLTGAFYVAQSVCRYMVQRRTGVVLNMSSKNGLDAELGHAHYNASKAGLILLTKTIAIELARFGVRANAVCPGYVRSPINNDVDSDEFVEEFADRYIPAGRVGTVADVAPVFLFLASDEAAYITGQTFVIDGGQLAGQKPWASLLGSVDS
ncbi:MAG: SDR family oxidoreductase [Pirellulaceae bacterium]|nr:SDR family oxidoreductase [Pirellulaceae bacterium]